MALNQLGLGLMFTATDMASGVMAKVRNGFAQTRDEAGRFGTRSKEAFVQFAKGAAMTTAGLGLVGALASNIPVAAEFGKKIAEIGTLTEEPTLNTGFLADEVLRLNAQYGGSTAKQAKAMYDGISAGASNASEATALLEASNQLAVAGVTDVGTALDGLTSSLNAYGRNFADAGEFSDYFFTAVKQGKTTIAEISNVIGRVAPTAASMNVSMQEVAASLSTITAKGLKTEEAATGLKAALANIINPTAEAAKEAARLGIKFDAASVREKGFSDKLFEIMNNSKFTEDSFSKLFGSVEGLNVVLALTSGNGEKFGKNLEGMKKASGAADAAFKKMSQTLAFQGERFKGLFENSRILIGQALEPIAMKVVEMANRWLEAFNKMPKGTRDMIVKAIALTGAVIAVAGAITMAVAAVKILAAALAPAAAGASGISAAIIPIGIAIAAVVAAIAAFKIAIENNVGGIATKFDGIIEPIKTAWEALVQLFTTGTLDEALTQELLNGDNAAVNFAVKVKQTADNIVEFFSGVGRGFEDAIKQAEPVFKAFGQAIDDLGTAFGGLVGPVSEVDSGFGEAGQTGSKVGGVLAKLATIIVDALTIAINIVTGFVEVWNEVSEALSDVFAAFGEVGSAIGEVVTALSGGTDGAAQNADTWKTVGHVLGSVVSVALKITASIISVVAGRLSDLATIARGVIDFFAGVFTGDWGRVWKGLGEIVAGVVNTIIDMVLGMVQVLADAADAVGKAFGKELGAGAALKSFREDTKNFVKGAFGVAHTEKVVEPTPTAQTMFNQSTNYAASVPAPAVAAAGNAPTTADWSIASTAAAREAAKGAMMSLPPTQVNATLMVNEEVLGRLQVKANASEASRSGQVVPVDVGG